MIRRGSALSRATAIGIAAAPALAALGAFGLWAIGHWTEASRRILAAEQRIHLAEARESQIAPYAMLFDAWSDYAAAPESGLVLASDPAAARAAAEARLGAAFAAGGGAVDRIAVLRRDVAPGLSTLRLEVSGRAPAAALPIVLASIEDETPRFSIEMAEIVAPAGAEDALTLRLRVAAYRLTEAIPGAARPTVAAARIAEGAAQ